MPTEKTQTTQTTKQTNKTSKTKTNKQPHTPKQKGGSEISRSAPRRQLDEG